MLQSSQLTDDALLFTKTIDGKAVTATLTSKDTLFELYTKLLDAKKTARLS